MTRHNVVQLDAFKAIANQFGAQLRITRLRPSGRGADVWDDLHPTADQQRELYEWLLAHGEKVLTGDSFFHLAGYGQELPGLNLCGAGRLVCLIDPVGDVYACPFAIHDAFLAGNLRGDGGFARVWRHSELFASLRVPQSGGACTSCSAYDACQGGCMAAKFFTGLPLDGPDPECVRGFGAAELAGTDKATTPRPSGDHSHRQRAARSGRQVPPGRRAVPVSIGPRPDVSSSVRSYLAYSPRNSAPIDRSVPDRACDQSPLAGFTVSPSAGPAASRPAVR
jgi:radical SAM protein with 4Fe4S-binding SPASM domain